jgi:branched-chain amino acid transport system permease protein
MNNAQKLGLAVLLVLYALLPQFLKSYGIYLMTLLCVYLMAAFGLNLIVGYAGQMSIGQAAFYGIGAYTAAILMTKLGMSFWLVLPIAAIICFAVGLALGFPALRVQHHYLAFATLGFNVLVFLVMRNEESSPEEHSGSPIFRGRRCSAIRSMAPCPSSISPTHR